MMPVKIRERAMAMLDVKSVPNLLGTSVSYAYAVKSGPWIFLGAPGCAVAYYYYNGYCYPR